jgi:hypothetical protein
MAHIFRLKASIPFTHTYYDSTGGIVSPGTAITCWVTYPPSSTIGNFPYCTNMETTTVSLTLSTDTGSYSGSWASTGASPGWCHWHISSSASTLDVAEGAFELRGNPAGMAST